MNLPDDFLVYMKQLLGDEYDDWLSSYDKPPHQGLRINIGKISTAQWEQEKTPFGCEKVPWISNGYYYDGAFRPAKHPYYHAGLYYLQEPSAMTPAQLLPIEPGNRVLDLCAAPGGKSTELGARLCGEGLLVSNDISNSRARALLKNLELFGIPNICVTSESPDKLAQVFGCYFDRILVDAPCSGEGMFRKDPELIKSWLEHGPSYYAGIQRNILRDAVTMLKPGGYLLYSTCTFAEEEDEQTIAWLLETYPEMILCDLPLWEGASPGIHGEAVIRLFPHKIQGEGHFIALLQKQESEFVPVHKTSYFENNRSIVAFLEKETDFFSFERQLRTSFHRNRLMVKQDMVYHLPTDFDSRWHLRYLRTGLLLGELKKGRFEPSQALAMYLKQSDFERVLSFSCSDERVIRYLKGETITLADTEVSEKSWHLVCVDGHPLGWGKCIGGTLKNKYYPGWRWQ